MVEWNFEYRFMIDMINSSIANHNFEGLSEWFGSLREDSKHEFKRYCESRGLNYYDFAEVINGFYSQNPDVILSPNHHRKLIDWLFEKAWYCDIVTIHKTRVIADLIDLILFYKIIEAENSESHNIYLLQHVSIVEPLLTNYIKYKMYDEAWEMAADCYSKVRDRDKRFTPWEKIFIHRLAEIGKLRGKYSIRLTPEMKSLALEGVGLLSKVRYNLFVWKRYCSEW